VAGRVQNPEQPDHLDQFVMDQLYLVTTLYGPVTDWLRWHIGLSANAPLTGSTSPPVNVGVLDFIVKIEPHPLFNLWVGRMGMAVDRDVRSGPWFINYWTFTGYLGNRPGPPIGVKTGLGGRDNGATLWGQVPGGKLRYFLGAFHLDSRSAFNAPMFTARLDLSLLDPEPGYFHKSAYHGEKNVVSLGAGIQYQRDGSVATTPPPMPGAMPLQDSGTLTIATADLLVDLDLGGAGVGTFQAAAYLFDRRQPVRQFYNLDLGWVLPRPLAPARIAPAVRYQFTRDPTYQQVDGYLQLLIKSHFAKLLVGFSYADLAGVRSKAIQAGIQIFKM
jgi:hypothetical protein